MAKVKYRIADENDPIYKEGFYVSSRMYSREKVKSKESLSGTGNISESKESPLFQSDNQEKKS
jgi:hypothetical protein